MAAVILPPNRFPQFFQSAIEHSVEAYSAHFRTRLAAVYVSGSVHRDEAVPGVSDLDLHPFIIDARREADERWWQEAQREFAELKSLCRPHPLTGLLASAASGADSRPQKWYPLGVEASGYPLVVQRSFWMRLHYDATLVWGRSLTQGQHINSSERLEWARGYFPALRETVCEASSLSNKTGVENALPAQPSLRRRKLARLTVLSGVCLLAGQDEFPSFRGSEILPALERLYPEWKAFFVETKRYYIQPHPTTTTEVEDYLSRLTTWMDHAKSLLGAA